MAKDKVTITIDPHVLADTDADAAAAGFNRSEYVERVLRDAHYARLLAQMPIRPPMSIGEERTLRGVLAWQHEGVPAAPDASAG